MSDANASKVGSKRPKRPTRRRPALTLLQVKFCEAYVEKGNATEAYVAAGFTTGSRESAQVMAWRLLRNPAVAALIREMREEALAAARVSVNRLAAAMAAIAFANRADLFDSKGRLLPAHQWPVDVAATVESIESEEVFETVSKKGKPKRKELRGHVRSVKTAKRMDALKVLAQWKRMIGRDAELEQMLEEIERMREVLSQLRDRHEEPS